MLTFHWRQSDAATVIGPAPPGPTLFVIDRPRECIDLVRRKYASAKRRKMQEEARKSEEDEDDEDEDEADGDGEEQKKADTPKEVSKDSGAAAETAPAPALEPAIADL